MSNSPEVQRIIDRIKKCLALGDKDRNPSEAEAETAISMAKALMAQYNLSMADVAEADPDALGKIVETRLKERSAPPAWEISLGAVCDNLFSTYHYLSKGWKKDTLVFVGYSSDTALAVEVYKLLKLELLALAQKWDRSQDPSKEVEVFDSHGGHYYSPIDGLSPAQRRTRRFKYLEGVVITLHNRSWTSAEERRAATAANERALVIADRRRADSEAFAKSAHKLNAIARRDTGMHGDAFDKGIDDGKKVDLNFNNKVRAKASSNAPALPYKGGSNAD